METSKPKMSNTKKSGYSLWYIRKRTKLRRTVIYFRIAKASRDHKQAERMARQLNSTYYGTRLNLTNIPATRNREHWAAWLETSRAHVSSLTNELDSRHRTRARSEANKHLRKLEAHRQISREKGKYYNYIRVTKRGSKPPLSVATKNSNGSLTMHIGKEAHLTAESAYLSRSIWAGSRIHITLNPITSTQCSPWTNRGAKHVNNTNEETVTSYLEYQQCSDQYSNCQEPK